MQPAVPFHEGRAMQGSVRHTARWFREALGVCGIVVLAGSGWAADGELPAQTAPSFVRDIAPILQDHCLECHREGKARGRYRLDTYEALLRPGASGERPVVSADAADAPGEWLRLILHEAPDERMPQDAPPLAAPQVALLQQWMAAGALFDGPAGGEAQPWVRWIRAEVPAPPERYPHPLPVTAIAFHPNGRWLVTSGWHELLVWELPDGRLRHRWPGLPERVMSMEWTPDGRGLVVAGGTPGRSGEVRWLHGQHVPDGSEDGLADADTESGAWDAEVTLWRGSDTALVVALSPAGDRVAMGGVDGVIRGWTLPSGELWVERSVHADWVMDLAWSRDGQRLGSASRDRTARVALADTLEGEVSHTEHGSPVEAILLGVDDEDTLVWTAGRDRQVRIWAREDSRGRERWGGFGGDVLRLAPWGPDVVAGAKSGEIRLRAVGDSKKVRNLHSGGAPIQALAVDRTGRWMASGDHAGWVTLWTRDESGERQPEMHRKFRASPGWAEPEGGSGPGGRP